MTQDNHHLSNHNPYQAPRADLKHPNVPDKPRGVKAASNLAIAIAAIFALITVYGIWTYDDFDLWDITIPVGVAVFYAWAGYQIRKHEPRLHNQIPLGYIAAIGLVLLGFSLPLFWLFAVAMFIYVVRIQRSD